MAAAGELDVPVAVGNIHTSDLFYNPTENAFDIMEKMNVLAVEMEAAGLYGLAAEHGARALTIVTVSDHIRTGEQTSSEEREKTFDDMIEVALRGLQIDAG